jgi:hypothetical protein
MLKNLYQFIFISSNVSHIKINYMHLSSTSTTCTKPGGYFVKVVDILDKCIHFILNFYQITCCNIPEDGGHHPKGTGKTNYLYSYVDREEIWLRDLGLWQRCSTFNFCRMKVSVVG